MPPFDQYRAGGATMAISAASDPLVDRPAHEKPYQAAS